MTIQRVSTYSIHQNTLNDVGKTQAHLADLQGQISSGKKTNNFQGLGNQTEHFVGLENKLAKADTYIANNSVILARVNTAGKTMDSIIGTVDDMENLLLLRQNSTNSESLQFTQQLLSMRERLTEMVNSTFDGRYMFGGTNTNRPPVADEPTSATPGVPDTSYYQGSSEDVFARLDDNIEMKYAPRADSEGFQKVIAAISQAMFAGDSGNTTSVENAYNMMKDGLGDLISEKAKIDANIVSIEATNTRHQDLKLYWTGVKENLINTDIISASTEVAIDQAVLQASFQSFSTINRLRLVDFL